MVLYVTNITHVNNGYIILVFVMFLTMQLLCLCTENYGQKFRMNSQQLWQTTLHTSNRMSTLTFDLFCDNCFGQNKNCYLFAILDQLCANYIDFKEFQFPTRCLNRMTPIDRAFALLERKRLAITI